MLRAAPTEYLARTTLPEEDHWQGVSCQTIEEEWNADDADLADLHGINQRHQWSAFLL